MHGAGSAIAQHHRQLHHTAIRGRILRRGIDRLPYLSPNAVKTIFGVFVCLGSLYGDNVEAVRRVL